VRPLPWIGFARHDLVAHKPLGALLQGEQFVGDREVHSLSRAGAMRIVEQVATAGKRLTGAKIPSIGNRVSC
jgi:hypothetical protein